MIKEEQAKNLAEILKLDAEKTTAFVTALTSEEEADVTIPELKIFTPDELSTRETNLQTEFKAAGYSEGKVAGIEMDVKQHREALGLEFEGKTVGNLLEAHKASVLKEANKEPDKLVEELKKEKTTLQQTIDTLKQSHQTDLNALNGKLTSQSIDVLIESEIQNIGTYPEGMTASDVKTLIRSGHEFSSEDGKISIKKNGEVMKDDKLEPLKINAVIADFFAERKWTDKKRQSGRDEGDDFGEHSSTVVSFKKIQSADELEAYCKSHNLQVQSDTVVALMEKHMSPEQQKRIMQT